MSVHTVAVAIACHFPNGEPCARGRVTFVLTDNTTEQGVAEILSAPQSIELDDAGEAVVRLFPNSRGVQPTKYRVEFRDAAGVRLARVTAVIPDADCALDSCIEWPAPQERRTA